jgi:hypothetical protein
VHPCRCRPWARARAVVVVVSDFRRLPQRQLPKNWKLLRRAGFQLENLPATVTGADGKQYPAARAPRSVFVPGVPAWGRGGAAMAAAPHPGHRQASESGCRLGFGWAVGGRVLAVAGLALGAAAFAIGGALALSIGTTAAGRGAVPAPDSRNHEAAAHRARLLYLPPPGRHQLGEPPEHVRIVRRRHRPARFGSIFPFHPFQPTRPTTRRASAALAQFVMNLLYQPLDCASVASYTSARTKQEVLR